MTEAARAPKPGEIPIIDLGPLRDGSDPARVAAEIGAACRGTGFFYVVNHGVPALIRDAMLGAGREFFKLPAEEKAKTSITHSRHNRGYVPFESEALDPDRPGDAKEAFNMGRELAPDDPDLLAGKPFHGPNQWPATPHDFRPALLNYFDAMLDLGQDLHRAFARDLGLDEDFFADKIDKPLATLRLLHYPPHPGAFDGRQYGAAPHTDYGNVTILWQDQVGGLEVRARSGEWIAATPVADSFVCNIGDCLMRWSNDVYVSTPHRVVNRSGRERWSVAYFLDPNADAPVVCLPGDPARYPDTTGAAYLKERLDATYSFRRT
ncbi:MAG: isopenicillin N synthase family oxygenase [Alphaproteobacteria bacterium]|nr:isopenicillin N synthase family oxygenase [Alphaproteobacteria bacterium]